MTMVMMTLEVDLGEITEDREAWDAVEVWNYSWSTFQGLHLFALQILSPCSV